MTMTKLDEAAITSQGQVSIPKRVREKLHVKKGDRIAFFEDEKGRIYLQEIERPLDFTADDWAAFLEKADKEPVTRLKGKKEFIKHLDKLKRK